MQRLFDLLFSGLAIIILSPLFIMLMVILKITGEGEIFFFQKRIGQNGELIRLFKFATMMKNSENIGTGTVTLHNDPRILPLGSLLRKTKINELPQLFNIFAGDMSVIGPRPQTERCFKAFPEKSQNIIIRVRPGLSGIGSIVFRNEEEMMSDHQNADDLYDRIIMPYKGLLEEWFVENDSLVLYFVLTFITMCSVVHPNNRLVWKLLKGLPEPPPDLEQWLKSG